jgi:putative acetyltransferase
MLQIVQAISPEQIQAAREIFREYEAWLGVSLCFQGFEAELAQLPGRYVSPHGRLLLALQDGEVAGCVALRPLEPGICEVKRLFVRDKFRGMGLGRMLLLKLIGEARSAGYEKMRLDSWPPKMGNAISMYRSHGFVEIEPYNDNPYDVIYMELDLSPIESNI